MPITTKFELDIPKIQQLEEAIEFAIKHKCPAIVVPSDFVAAANLKRGVRGGNFKIICAVDWPKGLQFSNEKFRGLDAEALSADGFEVLLTPGNLQQVTQEIKYLATFVDEFFSTNVIELRFVLGCHLENRNDTYIANVLKTIKTMRHPCMIRTTPMTKIPATKATVVAHRALIESIRSITKKPLKISGNINSKTVVDCKAEFYAVTVQQANNIVSDLNDIKDLGK